MFFSRLNFVQKCFENFEDNMEYKPLMYKPGLGFTLPNVLVFDGCLTPISTIFQLYHGGQ